MYKYLLLALGGKEFAVLTSLSECGDTVHSFYTYAYTYVNVHVQHDYLGAYTEVHVV